MKTRILALAALAGAFFLSSPALAAEAGGDLAKSKGCLGCHDMEKKKAGPAFKEVAKKGGKADAMVEKIKNAKGHPKSTATEAELKTIVDWVLAQK